jgi:hypothetical protein
MQSKSAREMGPMATLHAAALDGRDYLPYFSDLERQEILGTRNGKRRRERVAGRLAAKFLFLQHHSATGVERGKLMHLTAAHLERFTEAQYRSAAVFRNEEICAGLPQICWSDRAATAKDARTVAITHTDGLACAFLGTEDPVAVDLESAETRAPVFYAGNFTGRERSWAAECSERLNLDLHWTFTFLWGVKECLLKTPWFRDLSIADLPSMDVRITSGEEQLVYPHAAREFLAGFVFLQAEVADRSRNVSVNLAVSGRHDLVLTAVTAVQRRIA